MEEEVVKQEINNEIAPAPKKEEVENIKMEVEEEENKKIKETVVITENENENEVGVKQEEEEVKENEKKITKESSHFILYSDESQQPLQNEQNQLFDPEVMNLSKV